MAPSTHATARLTGPTGPTMLPRMSRRVSLASLAVVLLACNPGSGGSDASSSSTGPTSTGTATSTSTATTTPTTGATTGTTSTATTTTTTGPGDPSTSTATTGAVTSATSTGDPSTGGSGACVDVSGDYGGCEAELGYGFDGTSCRLFSGCDCAPNCEHFAPDPVGCASACAAAGHCDESKIKGAALAKDAKVEVGTACDEVDACATPDPSLQWLKALVPGLQCEAGFPCEGGQSCHLQFAGTIDAAAWAQMCAASLLPGAEVYCVIWGP